MGRVSNTAGLRSTQLASAASPHSLPRLNFGVWIYLDPQIFQVNTSAASEIVAAAASRLAGISGLMITLAFLWSVLWPAHVLLLVS